MLVLIIIIRFQRQLRTAVDALEAARMEEREILQRSNAIHLVDDFIAPQARRLIEIRSIHGCCAVLVGFDGDVRKSGWKRTVSQRFSIVVSAFAGPDTTAAGA